MSPLPFPGRPLPATAWWLAILLLPWSLPVPVGATGFEVAVPLEPMLLVAGLLLPFHPAAVPRLRGALRHPAVVVALASLAWMALASTVAADPLVAFKGTLVRTLHLAVVFLGGLVVLPAGSFPLLVLPLALSFLPFSLLVLARRAASRFDPASTYESARPFFSNRIDLAAPLSILLVVLLVLLAARPAIVGWSRAERRLAAGTAGVAAVTLLLLGARAPLPAVVAGLVAFGLLAAPPTRGGAAAAALLATGLLLGTAGLVAARALLLEPAPSTRSTPAALESLRRPLGALDESVAERLNRWAAAARMTAERPVAGFGPAHFERSYGPFQDRAETTRTSRFLGDAGNAHSEPFGTMAEQGIPGLLLLLLLGATLAATGWRASRPGRDAPLRAVAVAATAGLAAAALLEMPNSLLASDDAAPLLWLLAAVLVAADREGGREPSLRAATRGGAPDRRTEGGLRRG